MGDPFFRVLLKHELSQRCERNPRYSLRSFARSLGVDPGLLSKVLARKRRLTLTTARQMARHLELDPQTERRFFHSLPDQEDWTAPPPGEAPDAEHALLDEVQFQTIADLRHYGILELSTTEGFQSNPRWIAARLGMTVIETQLAIERLLRLGLLVKEDGTLRKRAASITTRDKSVTSAALKRHQKQVLQLALLALETEPLERRSMTSMTMAVAAGKLPLAKRLIQQFMDDLCDLMQASPLTEVYQLGVSLYPLAQSKETDR